MSGIDTNWERFLKLIVTLVLGGVLSAFVLGTGWLVMKLAGADVSY